MRPNAPDPARSPLSLNEVFGSKGQVRLLRILATETDGFVASPEVAARAGLTRSGQTAVAAPDLRDTDRDRELQRALSARLEERHHHND